jgi:hypothetical protein
MRRNLLTLTALTILSTATITLGASASCDSTNTYGYMWVYGTCTQNRTTSPKNVCEVSRDTTEIHNVLFISSLVYYEPNHRYPSDRFFDKVQSQHNISIVGTNSNCYRSSFEAETELGYQTDSYRQDNFIIKGVTLKLRY